MKKNKLSVVRRPKCRGWYIRPTEDGKSHWVFLSEQKTEAEKLAFDYERQRTLKRVEGVNLQADIALVIEKYLKEKFSTTLTTRKSRQRCEVIMKRFQEFIKRYPIVNVSDITREMVADYLTVRNGVIADRTWNMERVILSNFFKFCLNNSWAIRNPVSKIPQKKLEVPHIEHLSAEEAEKLLSYLKGTSSKIPYYEIIATLLYTGMRVNEALYMTKNDVLLDKNLLIVQSKVIRGRSWVPKTKKTRYVPIPAVIRPIIEEQLKTQKDLLFTNSNDNFVKDRQILQKMHSSCKKLGFRRVHTHSLRHTFCSVSSEKGIPEPFIQAVLGHTTPAMTGRYRHLRPEFLGDTFKDFNYGHDKNQVL